MRRRLLLGYMTITVLVLLVLELPLGYAYATAEQRRLLANVQHDALALSIRAHEPVDAGSAAALGPIVDAYRTEVGGRVVIVDRDGVLLADSDPLQGSDPQRSFADRPEFRAALDGEEVDGTRYSDTLGRDLLYVAVPVVSNGAVIGALRVTYPTSYVDARVRRVWILLGAVAIAVIAIVFLVSLRLARSVTRPVSELEDAAQRLGEGDLAARAPVPDSPEELRVLAESFNATATRLGSLVESQRAFVADASHQLRTPLQALRFRLETLELDVAAGRPADGTDVEGALAEVARLSRLVDALLALARAEGASSAPVATPLDAVVGARVDAWSPLAAEHDVTIDARVDEGTSVLVTPGYLDQALDNVLSNAIEVAPADSVVRIVAGADAGVVGLRVTDAGPGMDPEQRARAFDRFWRPAGASSGGSGLGLAIVRSLIEADGGSVELDAAPGGGLEVRMTMRSAARSVR